MWNEKRAAPPSFLHWWKWKTFEQWSARCSNGVGTFTNTSTFDKQGLQFVTTNNLEKSVAGGL